MKAIDPNLGAVMPLRSRPSGQAVEGPEALREFDAYFLAQILKGAQSASEEHMLDGGSAGRMYRDYFYDELARVLAERGGFGLTEQLKDSLRGPTSEERDLDRETDA